MRSGRYSRFRRRQPTRPRPSRLRHELARVEGSGSPVTMTTVGREKSWVLSSLTKMSYADTLPLVNRKVYAGLFVFGSTSLAAMF